MIYFGFYFNVKDAIPTNPVAAFTPLSQPKTSSVFHRGLCMHLISSPATNVSQPPRLSAGDCKCLTALISLCYGGGGGEGEEAKKSASGS